MFEASEASMYAHASGDAQLHSECAVIVREAVQNSRPVMGDVTVSDIHYANLVP